MQVNNDTKAQPSALGPPEPVNTVISGPDGTPSFSTVLTQVTPCYEPQRQLPSRIPNLEIRQSIMRDARSSPEEAYKLAHTYAFNSLTMPLVTSLTVTPQRYATGELITEESKIYFQNTMLTMQRERTELYKSEMEKGNNPVEIVEKILNFNDSLPPRFLDMCAW
jgi:hypothetical protein